VACASETVVRPAKRGMTYLPKRSASSLCG
jgi:hypothetical protein